MKKIIISVLLAAILVVSFSGCEEKGEPIIWEGLLLGEYLPAMDSAVGKLSSNEEDELRLELFEMSEMKYGEYIVLCQNFGYTIDSEKTGSLFTAFNEEGYKIRLSFWSSSNKLSIDLDAPMEMSEITWPTSAAAIGVPKPSSCVGKVEYDRDDFFAVYIGEMSKEAYNEYVDTCLKEGIDIEYDRSETYFSAENADGLQLRVEYKGANVIYIRAEIEEEKETPDDSAAEDKNEETQKPTEKKSEKIDKDFKKAMDAYEDFMDEYVKFMKKYKKNPSDLKLIADYAEYMKEYADFIEEFEAWEDKDLNAAETAYYIEVQTRVSKKLLEVAK